MMLDVVTLKEALPQNLRSAASQEMVDKINQCSTDPEVAQLVRDNVLGYVNVLQEGKFKAESYIEAVTYVSFKLMGHTNQTAYKLTFPARYQRMVGRGATEKEISAYVASYAKNKLVNLIYEQSVIPSWILNQDAYQEAINTQLMLMRTANSEKVQCEAANSILTHLKRPESKKIELDLSPKSDDSLNKLTDAMNALASRQLDLIGSGTSTQSIAHQRMAQEEIEDAEEI